VEAVPFQTKDGKTRSGGYYPIAYDPAQPRYRAYMEANRDDLFMVNHLRPTLPNGFAQARQAEVTGARLWLDLSAVLGSHLLDVAHYVTHYDAVMQADRVTQTEEFKALVHEYFGPEFHREIRPWLQAIARDNDTPEITRHSPVSSLLKKVRGGVSIATMGFNVATGLKQLLGITTSLDALGTRFWLKGMLQTLSPAKFREAFEKSQELEPLMREFDRDVAMMNRAYSLSMTGPAKEWIVTKSFWVIGAMQSVVNVAAFLGGYEQARQEGMSEADAIDRGDAIIRQTQGSGAIKDLSGLQRGQEIERAVSMFYTWFSVLYNRLSEVYKNPGHETVLKLTTRVAILVWFNALLEEGLAEILFRADEDEDEEDVQFAWRVALAGADTSLRAVPLLHLVSPVGQIKTAVGMPRYQTKLTPIERAFDDTQRLLDSLFEVALDDGDFTAADLRRLGYVTSVMFQKPIYGGYKSARDGLELFGLDVDDLITQNVPYIEER
jgi:hypothetical protein